jgi:hypothetical protein
MGFIILTNRGVAVFKLFLKFIIIIRFICRSTPQRWKPATQWLGGWLDYRPCLNAVDKRNSLPLPGIQPGFLDCPLLTKLSRCSPHSSSPFLDNSTQRLLLPSRIGPPEMVPPLNILKVLPDGSCYGDRTVMRCSDPL